MSEPITDTPAEESVVTESSEGTAEAEESKTAVLTTTNTTEFKYDGPEPKKFQMAEGQAGDVS